MKKQLLALAVLLACVAPLHAQTATTLPYAAAAVADIGNGPIKVRVVQGNASIFTSQSSGVGSTPGSSTALTLTATPSVPPIVGGLISGSGITSGTTVAAYDGTTGVTLSAAMTVPASTPLAWGATCPASAAGIPTHYIPASVMADYYLLYTQARVCAVSPGGPANTLLTLPVFYDQTTPGGGGGSVSFANPSATAGPTAVNGSASTAMRSDAAPAVRLASSSQSGLMPAWPGNITTFLRGDGSFATLNVAAIGGFGSGVATWLGTPTSANLAAALTDETGTGSVVFSASPTFSGTVQMSALTLSGVFTSNVTGGGTQCLQASNTGVVTGTGGACASGGTPGGTSGQTQYNNSGAFGGYTMSGDATINTGTGALTLATVNANVGAFGSATQCTTFTTNAKGLITAASQTTCTPALSSIIGFGTGVATAAGNPVSAAAGFAIILAKGTMALGTSAISAGTCGTATTATATGIASTDIVDIGWQGDPTGVTGYLPTATLSLNGFFSATNTVAIRQCNYTGSSITPSALTVNWSIRR